MTSVGEERGEGLTSWMGKADVKTFFLKSRSIPTLFSLSE